jgi:hypothetical protein
MMPTPHSWPHSLPSVSHTSMTMILHTSAHSCHHRHYHHLHHHHPRGTLHTHPTPPTLSLNSSNSSLLLLVHTMILWTPTTELSLNCFENQMFANCVRTLPSDSLTITVKITTMETKFDCSFIVNPDKHSN